MHDKLSEKLLKDFHGNAPTVNNTLKGTLPNLTKKAKVFVAQRLKENEYFRFGINGGGCSGFQYDIKPCNLEPNKFDEIVEIDNLKIKVDSNSLIHLIGTEIDWEDDFMGQRFIFKNPNSNFQCGCGKSFS